ncbi:site-specific integrase [Sphingobium chungangianum]|jgi:hypothetical protein
MMPLRRNLSVRRKGHWAPDAVFFVRSHKGDQEGEGATAFLSMRSVLAIEAWIAAMAELLKVPDMSEGPLFRRLFVKRLPPVDPTVVKAAARRHAAALHLGLQRLLPDAVVPRRWGRDPLTVVTLGTTALRPQAVSAIFKARVQGAWEKGLLPDLTAEEVAEWVKGGATEPRSKKCR